MNFIWMLYFYVFYMFALRYGLVDIENIHKTCPKPQRFRGQEFIFGFHTACRRSFYVKRFFQQNYIARIYYCIIAWWNCIFVIAIIVRVVRINCFHCHKIYSMLLIRWCMCGFSILIYFGVMHFCMLNWQKKIWNFFCFMFSGSDSVFRLIRSMKIGNFICVVDKKHSQNLNSMKNKIMNNVSFVDYLWL